MHASTWQLMSRSAAMAAMPGIGSITPCGYCGCGTDHQDRVVVDRVGHRVDVGLPVVAHRHTAALEAEVVAALLERGVRAGGQHHVRGGDATLLAAALAGALHGHQQALGAARRHETGTVGAGLQPVADDADDVGLQRAQARERVGVQRVLRAEASVGLLGHRHHVLARAVGQGERVAVAPSHVVRLHPVESVEDLVAAEADAGERHAPETNLARCPTARPSSSIPTWCS